MPSVGSSGFDLLLGRRGEMDYLCERLSNFSENQGKPILITGEPGIGNMGIINTGLELIKECSGLSEFEFELMVIKGKISAIDNQKKGVNIMMKTVEEIDLDDGQLETVNYEAYRIDDDEEYRTRALEHLNRAYGKTAIARYKECIMELEDM